jgi:hypothetical protein
MSRFLTRYRMTPTLYQDLKIKVLTGKAIQAVQEFKNFTGLSLTDAQSALLTEFKLEYKLSGDMFLYASIQRIESYEGINNLPIASDIGIILDFAKNQLCRGLSGSNPGQS